MELPNRKYLLPREVGLYYRNDPKTLKRLADRGEFPKPVKVGGKCLWWRPALVEFDRKLQEAAQ